MEKQEESFEDIEQLQTRLLGRATSLVKPEKEITPPIAIAKNPDDGLSRKDKLTQDIERLRKAQGLTVQSNNHYRKATIAQLESELARLAERGIGQLQSIPVVVEKKQVKFDPDTKEPTVNNDYPRAKTRDFYGDHLSGLQDDAESENDNIEDEEFEGPPMNWNEDTLGKTLFQLNQILAGTAESLSMTFKSEIGTSLEGYTQELETKKDELTNVLLEIYYERHEAIAPFMTPMAKYGIIMASSAGNVAMANAKKQGKNV